MGREAELLRIGVGGVVPVRWDLAKSDDGAGTLTGWASVYGNVDQQEDVVMPGAFRKWLARWRTAKTVVPLTLDHENGTRGTIGSLVDVVDKPAVGLRTTFKFSSDDEAQRARTRAREGHVVGLSMFGAITNKSVEMVDDRPVRILREIDPLMAVGLTPFPANQKALVTAVKDPTGKVNVPDIDPLPEPWVSDMRHAITLTNATARALAVKTLLADLASTTATGVDHEDTHDEGSPAEPETNDDKAASLYALSLIGESEPEGSPAGGPADLDDLLAQVNVGETSAQIDALAKELGATQ